MREWRDRIVCFAFKRADWRALRRSDLDDKGRVLMYGNAQRVSKAYEQSVWDKQEAINLSETRKISDSIQRTAKLANMKREGGKKDMVGRHRRCERRIGGCCKEWRALRIRISWKGRTEHRQIYASMRIDGPRLQAVAGIEGYDAGVS